MPITVLLADDHRILRHGIRAMLEQETDISVVGEASDGREARALAHQLKPNVIVMDVAMPVLTGIEATRCIRAELPDVRVLGLSARTDKNHLTSMLRAGASGYLFKQHCNGPELVRAIRHVAEGRAYVDPDVMEKILEEYRHNGAPAPMVTVAGIGLTLEEKEVLQYLAEGATLKEIAARMEVCSKTVERTRDRIMERLLISSIAGLTKFAIRNGLTPLE